MKPFHAGGRFLAVLVTPWLPLVAWAGPEQDAAKGLESLVQAWREKEAMAASETAKIPPETVRKILDNPEILAKSSMGGTSKSWQHVVTELAWGRASNEAKADAYQQTAVLKEEATDAADKITEDEGLAEACAKKLQGAILETTCKRLFAKAIGNHPPEASFAEEVAAGSASGIVTCLTKVTVARSVDARAGELAEKAVETAIKKTEARDTVDAPDGTGASSEARGDERLLLVVRVLCESMG